MLIVNGLSKTFNGQPALDGLSFALSRGTVALLGSNGAGKSTLLRLLATLEHPESGYMSWRGLDYRRENLPDLRARIGYLSQYLDLPGELTPRKLLHYLGHLREVTDKREIDGLLDRLGIASLADRRLSTLSGGQLRLVGVAQALLGAPDLLLLDELLRGLSFDERGRVMQLVRDTSWLTIFSTHVLKEAEYMADVLIVLHRRRMIFHGTVDELKEMVKNNLPPSKVKQIMPQKNGHHISHYNERHTLSLEEAYLLLLSQVKQGAISTNLQSRQ